MAAYQDQDLFGSVTQHHSQFSHVTSTQGAFAFNQSFERPLIEQERTGVWGASIIHAATLPAPTESEPSPAPLTSSSPTLAPPKLTVDIIDVVQRTAMTGMMGMMEETYIEFVIKLSISIGGGAPKMKISGKRFSQLETFHDSLMQAKLLADGSPPFPDKNNLHGNWMKFNDKDPNSEFVQQRKSTLTVYFNQLLEVNQNLAYDPTFMAFFDMEEISMQAAMDASARTAAYHDSQVGAGAGLGAAAASGTGRAAPNTMGSMPVQAAPASWQIPQSAPTTSTFDQPSNLYDV